MAEAAAAEQLSHVIWSTLEDTRERVPPGSGAMPLLMGRYNVPHFDAKGEADHLFREAGVPTTRLLTSFYWDNMVSFGMGPKPGPDGRLVLTLPMADRKLAGIAAGDIGRCAFGVLDAGDKFIGRAVGIAGGHLTGAQMAAELAKALGRPVDYNAVTWDQYRAFGFPGADDLANMFQYYCMFESDFCAARPLETSRALNPALQTFAQWLAQHKGRIPLA